MKTKINPHHPYQSASTRLGVLLVTFTSFNIALAQTNTGSGPNANVVTSNGTNAALSITTGLNNTAYGNSALKLNTTGDSNTALGSQALKSNIDGNNNTAVGASALLLNTGSGNSALGQQALRENTTGGQNTALGVNALFKNTTGSFNTATGREALNFNTTGASNVATGYQALRNNTIGGFNVAIGDGALLNNTIGSGNIALGEDAGSILTNGNNNIRIGNKDDGLASENGIIRIGQSPTHTDTYLAGVIHGNGSGLTGITSAGLAAGSVTRTQIAAGAVGSSQLAAGSVTGTRIAASAVGSSQLATGSVTGTQIATGAVGTSQLAEGSVTGTQIAAGAVGSSQLAPNLSLSGDLTLPATSGTAGAILSGGVTLLHSFGYQNVFVGARAGNRTMTGYWNTASGFEALYSNTIGHSNTSSGYQSLYSNTSGHHNTAVGSKPLNFNTTGYFNTAVGSEALYNNTTGYYNTAIGLGSLYNITDGYGNIALGESAGLRLIGSNNIAIGNEGNAADFGIIRIGDDVTHTDTYLAGIIHGNGSGLSSLTGTLNYNGTAQIPIVLNSSHNGGTWLSLRNSSTGAREYTLITTAPGNGEGVGKFLIRDSSVGAIRMAIDTAGNVGIGTFNPAAKLEVNGGIKCIGAVNTSSDARYKTNVSALSGALEEVLRLRGVSYDWKRAEFPDKGFNDRRQLGFIAQEVREILPEVVSEDAEGYLAVGYTAIIPVLAEGIKELHARHETAMKEKDTEIAALKRQVATHEKQLAEQAENNKSIEARLASLETAARPVAERHSGSRVKAHKIELHP